MEIHTVEIKFNRSGWIETTVEIGPLGTTDHSIDLARQQLQAQRSDLGTFQVGRVTAP
jgi:hypothetical protein